MLSEHEFCQAIEELYPKIKKIDAKCTELLNKKYIPGRGVTFAFGDNELDFSISLLRSASNMLETLKEDFYYKAEKGKGK